MQVAFYKAFQPSATTLDTTVAVLSFGQYSHVELIFSDGMAFSVSPRDKGTRFKKINFNPEAWDILDTPMVKETEDNIRSLANVFLGYKYDYIGAIFSISPVCIQKDKRFFCSELVTNLLNHCVYYNALGDGCKYSPNKLYKELRKINV
jgi:hypothetical protein